MRPIEARPRQVPTTRAIGVGACALIASLTWCAAALGSTVQVDSNSIEIDGDNNDDAITLTTDGTNLTITDTGTGGVTAGVNCMQVNATTVRCPAALPGFPPIARFDVDLGDGIDSFVNENVETRFAFIDAFEASGSKTVAGGPGSQSIYGGLDDDNLDGGPGEDQLQDGGGDDPTSPTGGNDLLAGGPGEDWTFYNRSAPLSLSLDGQANDGEAGEADNVQTENVIGGMGNDALTGDDARNLLVGFGGADTVRGRGGNDGLYGELPAGVPIGPIALIRATRGLAFRSGGDTLDGGAGADELDCGGGFDLALRDPLDEVRNDCERVGASVVGDSTRVTGKGKRQRFKVPLSCPATEVEACAGTLEATANGKRIAKGNFNVPSGRTKRARAKLTKKGRRTLRAARGKLLVTVEATTNEPGGASRDAETIFLHPRLAR